jgi:hypothetical protein
MAQSVGTGMLKFWGRRSLFNIQKMLRLIGEVATLGVEIRLPAGRWRMMISPKLWDGCPTADEPT